MDALLDQEGSYWFSGVGSFVNVSWHAITYSELDELHAKWKTVEK